MSITTKCTLSGDEFLIRDEDIDFYNQISPVIGGKKFTIPPPMLCPRCRECRSLSYRNERKLYRRASSFSGEPIISFYHPKSPWVVYSHDEWWSDNWDPLTYGRDFDFSRGFFEQFYDLQLVVPRPPLINNKAENAAYCNFADANRNCYLLTCSNRNLDSYYGFFVLDCKDAVDCTYCMNSELLYECVECEKCYNLNFSQNCTNCVDSSFLFHCQGVSNCLFCVNLRNREQYYILNQPTTKSEYQKVLGLIKTDKTYRDRFIEQWGLLKLKSPVKALNLVSCENVTGNDVYNSKNIYEGFTIWDSENCAYIQEGLTSSNCMDICFFEKCQWCYESMSLIGYGYRFTNFCRDSYDLFYCDNCHGCKNCFGCIGLRRKEYCILNKQYTKAEYEELVPRIIEHMVGKPMRAHSASAQASEVGSSRSQPSEVEPKKEWGEFFPEKYSFFGYNETLANDFFPLTKEEALARGYLWRE